MLLPPSIFLKNGEKYYPLWESDQHPKYMSPVLSILARFAHQIEDEWTDLHFSKESGFFFNYTGYGGIVMRATDRSLKFWRPLSIESDVKQCLACLGWGYKKSSNIEVWNGKPYIVKNKGSGDTRGINWKNPAWCKKCSGTGIKN